MSREICRHPSTGAADVDGVGESLQGNITTWSRTKEIGPNSPRRIELVQNGRSEYSRFSSLMVDDWRDLSIDLLKDIASDLTA